MTLISKTTSHHVSLGWSSSHVWVTIHNYIVLLDDRDAVLIRILLGCLLAVVVRGSVVLLGVNYVSTLHLRILNFYLRIVEDVVIIVDILYDLDWLILVLLFGL